MDYEEMTVKQLTVMAKELGVLPDGRPNKTALIAALQPGGPPKAEGPGEEKVVLRDDVYQYDRTYIVQESFSGYEPGDEIINFHQTLGQLLIDQEKIKLDNRSPRATNPHVIARTIPQT